MKSQANKKILAFIPARGGSKGVPRKNIIDVGGRPLVAWTIESARRSRFIDMVLVSSDDDQILATAAGFGALTLLRPAELATDTARVEKSVTHALKHLKKTMTYMPDVIVYLQPTSPMRDHTDIDQALELFFKKKADALISVRPLNKSYLKAFMVNAGGFLKPAVKKTYSFSNRQQLPDIFMPNGALYIVTREAFLRDEYLFGLRTLPFLMSEEKSIDLDTPEDLAAIRNVIHTHRYAKKK